MRPATTSGYTYTVCLSCLGPTITSEQRPYWHYHWRHCTSKAFSVHWPKRIDCSCFVISIVLSGRFEKSISVQSATWKDVPTAAIFNRSVNNAETYFTVTLQGSEVSACERACPERRCLLCGQCACGYRRRWNRRAVDTERVWCVGWQAVKTYGGWTYSSTHSGPYLLGRFVAGKRLKNLWWTKWQTIGQSLLSVTFHKGL
jgi:hypothetical protein